MRAKANSYVRNCLKCIAFTPKSGKIEGLLNPIPKGNVPFETIHVDHLGPIHKNNSAKRYVFIIIDAFTMFVKLYATKTTSSREVIDCMLSYFEYYNKPRRVISDRGTAFSSKEFESFAEEYDFKHISIATGSSHANGQVERANRVIVPMISKLISDDTSKV